MEMIGVLMQTYFSIQHLQSARYFSEQAINLEARLKGNSEIVQLIPKIKANAVGALFTAVAFLEALANEVFADAAMETGGHVSQLTLQERSILAILGKEQFVERSSIIAKFGYMLVSTNRKIIAAGCNPGQDLKLIIDIRNELTHYKAAWLDIGTNDMVREKSFMADPSSASLAKRVAPRAGSSSMEVDKWLSADFSKWVVKSVTAYADEVFNRLGLATYYIDALR
jgi:hypothetical protein